VGLGKQKAAPGAVLAYWLGNPVLNPATIIFLGFVLGWGWSLLRIAVGVALVAAAAWLGDRMSPRRVPEKAVASWEEPEEEEPRGSIFLRWVSAAGRLAVGLIPEYLIIVLILGATRAWLFPAMSPAVGHSVLLFIGLAIAGTLFVIPTAGEVPILQTLSGFGLGPLGAGALMITLPAVSLPSLVMVGKALPRRLLVQVALLVAAFGIVTGLLAALFHL